MPNYCENELKVRGTKEEALTFVKKAKGEKGAFSFSSLYPAPKSLFDVTAGSRENFYEIMYTKIPEALLKHMRNDGIEMPSREDALAYQAKLWNVDPKKAMEIANKLKHNIDCHGHLTWYTWCIENWGTKWDVENMSQLLSSKDITLRGKKTWSLLYLFGSAWSPPKDAILHISKDFSELEFTLSFWEGGNGFKGMFKCKDGKIKKDVTEEYSGRRGG